MTTASGNAKRVDVQAWIQAVHAANVLALWPDTVCAGDRKTRLVIRGGFPAGAVIAPGGVAVSPSGDNAAPPPRVMGFEPGEEGLEPRVIEEDPTLATMWRSIELYLDIPEDAFGLYDVTVACGGVQGYSMEKVLNVVKIELLTPDGEPIAEVPTLASASLNRSITASGANILPSSSYGEASPQFVVQMQGVLQPSIKDKIVVARFDKVTGLARPTLFEETDIASFEFRPTSQPQDSEGLVPVADASQTVVLADYPVGAIEQPDHFVVEFSFYDGEGHVATTVSVYQSEHSPDIFESGVVSLLLDRSTEGYASIVQLSYRDQLAESILLTQDPTDPTLFVNDDFTMSLGIMEATGMDQDVRDSVSIVLSYPDFDIVTEQASLVETELDSQVFRTPRWQPGWGGGNADVDDNDPDILGTAGFTARYTDVTKAGCGTWDIYILGETDGVRYKIAGRVTASEVSPGVFETGLICAVRHLDELDPEVADVYPGVEFVHGSGSWIKRLFGAAVHTPTIVFEAGDYVFCEIWYQIGALGDGKEANARIFWISDAMSCGTSSWTNEQGQRITKLADDAGWTDDWCNRGAEIHEILDDLRDMDSDDIFVFFGHSKIDSSGKAAALGGYDTWDPSAWGSSSGWSDPIKPKAIKKAMAESAPGLAIISACHSYDNGPVMQVFTGAREDFTPCRAYVGFTEWTSQGTALKVTKDFLTRLFAGETIQGAIGNATHKGQHDLLDFYFGMDNGDPKTWGEYLTPLQLAQLTTMNAGVSYDKTCPLRQMRVSFGAGFSSTDIWTLLDVPQPEEEDQ